MRFGADLWFAFGIGIEVDIESLHVTLAFDFLKRSSDTTDVFDSLGVNITFLISETHMAPSDSDSDPNRGESTWRVCRLSVVMGMFSEINRQGSHLDIQQLTDSRE